MSNDGIHQDINDCKYVKSHRFQEDPTNFLNITLYYDDVEIQNPLRSSQKYKLSMVYFQLLNIPVQFRSKLSSISLLAVCRSKNLQKFGVKNILQDLIETINVLGTSGLNLQINGIVGVPIPDHLSQFMYVMVCKIHKKTYFFH